MVAFASPAFASPPSPPRKLPVVTFGHRSYAELTTGVGGCAALYCDKCRAFGACYFKPGAQSNDRYDPKFTAE